MANIDELTRILGEAQVLLVGEDQCSDLTVNSSIDICEKLEELCHMADRELHNLVVQAATVVGWHGGTPRLNQLADAATWMVGKGSLLERSIRDIHEESERIAFLVAVVAEDAIECGD
jgi:hypothetical protein